MITKRLSSLDDVHTGRQKDSCVGNMELELDEMFAKPEMF